MISVVPLKLDWTSLSRQSSPSGAEQWTGVHTWQGVLHLDSGAAVFARCDLGSDHAPWDCLAARQLPGPRQRCPPPRTRRGLPGSGR